jgi:hypothetical protein
LETFYPICWHRDARSLMAAREKANRGRPPGLGELLQLISNAKAVRRVFQAAQPKPLPDYFFERVQRYADWGNKRAVLKLYRAARDL